jgi:hypothetical protein
MTDRLRCAAELRFAPLLTFKFGSRFAQMTDSSINEFAEVSLVTWQ